MSREEPAYVPPPVGCWPLALRRPTLDGAPMLAIGAGGEGRAGRIVPPPGARGQPWRWMERPCPLPAPGASPGATRNVGGRKAGIRWLAEPERGLFHHLLGARQWPSARPRCV